MSKRRSKRRSVNPALGWKQYVRNKAIFIEISFHHINPFAAEVDHLSTYISSGQISKTRAFSDIFYCIKVIRKAITTETFFSKS